MKVGREWPEEGKSQKVQEGALLNSKKMSGGDVGKHCVIDCDGEECAAKIICKFSDAEHWSQCWGGGRGMGKE